MHQFHYTDDDGYKAIGSQPVWTFRAAQNELFVYRDAQAADAWRTLGADPSNQNSMIHLLLSPTELTVVVDDPEDAVMSRTLAAIRAGLERDLLVMRAAA